MSIFSAALTLKDLPSPPVGKTGWPWTEAGQPIPGQMPNGSQWPKISIVTPSYNQGQFLEETIRSVLLQGYPNLEYSIIDGKSTDSSVRIIEKYSPHLSFWVSAKDEGQADAINKGLVKSTGEIIGWINSDDIYVKGILRKVAQAFQEYSECILIHGNRILIDEHSNVTGWSHLPPFNPSNLMFNICSETAFWKRSAMNDVGLLNKNFQFAVDLDFFGRLYHHGNFLKLADYMGYFRCYSSNKSSMIPHIGFQESKEIWKDLFGIDISCTKSISKKNFLQNLFVLSSNPSLITIPYVKYKIKKLFIKNGL